MKDHNKAMQEYLKQNGINAIPKYIDKGSMSGAWRLSGKLSKRNYNLPVEFSYQKWTQELADKLNALGFREYINGKPLDIMSGNGGMFAIFVHSTEKSVRL
jgi:hypothetical protein